MSRNQLDQETSPYLLLHKDNPVHWRAWGPEAFEEAQTTGKPILLSIGYTACHWCHVMNHESFQDPETAALMNELFVNIKVDREQRPDIDQIYQTAANALGHAGGWPLTMFLTPAAEAYFAGAYIPKDERAGQTSFKRALTDVAKIFKDQPDQVANTTARVQQSFATLWARDLRGEFEPSVLDQAAIHIGQQFDIFYGGLTGAPKFPTPRLIEIGVARVICAPASCNLPRSCRRRSINICLGGVYDHIGGGFSRYATDERWLVPHFEKMLYDNADLIDVLTLVWQHNRPPLFRERIEETIGWVLREMMVEQCLRLHASMRTRTARKENTTSGAKRKSMPCSPAHSPSASRKTTTSRAKGISRGATFCIASASLIRCRRQTKRCSRNSANSCLPRARNATAPMRDDKMLADWNGMMIAALANAGAVFRNTNGPLRPSALSISSPKLSAKATDSITPGAPASAATRALPTTTPIWRAPHLRSGKRRPIGNISLSAKMGARAQ